MTGLPLPATADQAGALLQQLTSRAVVVVDASALLADLRWRVRNSGRRSQLVQSLSWPQLVPVTVPEVIDEVRRHIADGDVGAPAEVDELWQRDYLPRLMRLEAPAQVVDPRLVRLEARDPTDLPLGRLIAAMAPVWVLAEDLDLLACDLAGTCSYVQFGSAVRTHGDIAGLLLFGRIAAVFGWETARALRRAVAGQPPSVQLGVLALATAGAVTIRRRHPTLLSATVETLGKLLGRYATAFASMEEAGGALAAAWVQSTLEPSPDALLRRADLWELCQSRGGTTDDATTDAT